MNNLDTDIAYPEVWIAVLHWQGVNYTKDCLSSLVQLRYPRVRTLLIINGSPDADASVLAQEFSGGTECLMLKENLGFAGGFNAGIKYCMERGAQWVWLLNNDTKVEPDSLSLLMSEALKNPRAAVLGAAVHYNGTSLGHSCFDEVAGMVHGGSAASGDRGLPDGNVTYGSKVTYDNSTTFDNNTASNNIVVSGPGQIDFLRAKTRLYPIRHPRSKQQGISPEYIHGAASGKEFNPRSLEQSTAATQQCQWLSGSNLLLRCAALTGDYVFDPDYFLYFEDTELCTRLRKAGWQCLFVPDACVHHAGGASTSGGLEYWRAYYYTRNRLLFFDTTFGSSKASNRDKTPGRSKTLCTGIDNISSVSRILGTLKAVPAFFSIYAHLLRHLLVLPFRGASGRKQLKAEMLGLRDYLLRRFGKATCLDWCE